MSEGMNGMFNDIMAFAANLKEFISKISCKNITASVGKIGRRKA